MAKSAVIIFDDTYLISNRSFWGKGSKSIPYLLKTTKFRIKGIGHEGFLMANFPLKN
jgi:hypothetical protein